MPYEKCSGNHDKNTAVDPSGLSIQSSNPVLHFLEGKSLDKIISHLAYQWLL
jgi:hypothetical protein